MLALFENVKYLCLEMGISVIYINEECPNNYQTTETLDPYRMPTTWRQYTHNKITRATMLLI